jgi:hypothetical protein
MYSRVRFPDCGLLSGRQLAQLRYPQVNDKPATGHKVPGGVAERRYLLALGQQAGDRVVNEVDEGVPAGGSGGGTAKATGSPPSWRTSTTTASMASTLPPTSIPLAGVKKAELDMALG